MRRISIAGSMGIVVLFGLGFTALRNADAFWASASFTVALAMISVAPVGVFARDVRTRMSWAGFALLGWASLFVWMSRLDPPQVVATGGGFGGGMGMGMGGRGGGGAPSTYVTQPLPPLLTDWALRRFAPARPAFPLPTPARAALARGAFPSGGGPAANRRPQTAPANLSRSAAWQAQLRSFDQVLHSVEILLLGVLGAVLGHVAAFLVERQPREGRGQEPPTPE